MVPHIKCRDFNLIQHIFYTGRLIIILKVFKTETATTN